RSRRGHDYIRRKRDQLGRVLAEAVEIARTPSVFDAHVATNCPAALLQPLRERGDLGQRIRIVRARAHKHANAPCVLSLLRAHRERPCHRRAANERDELATPHHSITSSARASSGSGIASPSALAAIRLMISSTFTDCCTGRSTGLSPLSTRPTRMPPWRSASTMLGPEG